MQGLMLAAPAHADRLKVECMSAVRSRQQGPSAQCPLPSCSACETKAIITVAQLEQ
jgi:hypothetical protein